MLPYEAEIKDGKVGVVYGVRTAMQKNRPADNP